MTNALVLGEARGAQAIAAQLNAAGLTAWTDRQGRAAANPTSLNWADLLVVIDDSPHLETLHFRPLLAFPGPSVLLLPAKAAETFRVRALDAGYDCVLGMDVCLDEFLARIRSLDARRAERWHEPLAA